MDVVQNAQRLADAVLFPAALSTDAAGEIPLTSLDERDGCRARLAELDPDRIAADRTDAGELALRCAAALMTATGSKSLLLSEHP